MALVSHITEHVRTVIDDESAAKIKKLCSTRKFRTSFDTAFERAIQLFYENYEFEDEDLVSEIATNKEVMANEEFQRALLSNLKRPLLSPGTSIKSSHSFPNVLPERKNRDRVDRALNFLVSCISGELWRLPELEAIYTFKEGSDVVAKQNEDSYVKSFSLSRPKIYQNLPRPTYSKFLGREKELKDLQRILAPYPKSQEHLVTIDGVGGIGKSALAIETARWYMLNYDSIPADERFEVIIWTSAKQSVLTADGILPRPESSRTLNEIYTNIAVTLQREDITRAHPTLQTILVKNALAQRRTLLIIDNLETIEDERVITFLRELPAPTKAIVTTRYRIDVAYSIRLMGLTWDEAERMIVQESRQKGVVLNAREASDLYQRTGGVPQAIVWAIARMGKHGIPATLQLLGRPNSDIARFCFEAIFEIIKQRNSYRMLLAMAGLTASTTREIIGTVAGFNLDNLSRDEALAELEYFSLASCHNNRWGLQPLVKQYTLETSDPKVLNEYMLRAAQCYADHVKEYIGDERIKVARASNYEQIEPERLNVFGLIEWCYENGFWDQVTRLVLFMGYFPHARGYWQDAIKYWEIGASAAQLINDQAMYSRFTTYLGYMNLFRGDLVTAAEYARRASIASDNLTPSYQQASIKRLQANLAEAQEDYPEAISLLERGLSIMKALGDRTGTAKILNDLGSVLIKAGDYETAERRLDESHTISKANDDWTEMTRGLRHLGDLNRLLNREAVARKFYKQSLDAAKEIGWLDEIAQVTHGLALLEWQCGKWESGRLLAQEALTIYEKIGQTSKSNELRETLSNWRSVRT